MQLGLPFAFKEDDITIVLDLLPANPSFFQNDSKNRFIPIIATSTNDELFELVANATPMPIFSFKNSPVAHFKKTFSFDVISSPVVDFGLPCELTSKFPEFTTAFSFNATPVFCQSHTGPTLSFKVPVTTEAAFGSTAMLHYTNKSFYAEIDFKHPENPNTNFDPHHVPLSTHMTS